MHAFRQESGGFLISRLTLGELRKVYAHFDWLTRHADKAAMARAFQARRSMGKVLFPAYPWADRVINQCVGFPAGRHDDAVDVCALIGVALDSSWGSVAPRKIQQPKPMDRWGRLFSRSRHRDFNWKALERAGLLFVVHREGHQLHRQAVRAVDGEELAAVA